MKFAEISVDANHPMTGVPTKVFMYIGINENYSLEMVGELLEQNREHLLPVFREYTETQQFESREDADAHVKKFSIDNWNGLDLYWWPPLVVGEKIVN